MPILTKHIILISFLFLSGCASAPHAIDLQESREQVKPFHHVYVISHGWHTAIVLPAQDIQSQMPELQSRFPHALI